MEPLSLAAAVVALLVPFFNQAAGKVAERAGEAIADSALPTVRALYERLRTKLGAGTYEGALLDGVQDQPDDPDRQQSLKVSLAKLIAQDASLQADLERLVAEADVGGIGITATDAGAVAGRDVLQKGHYVAGRDMTIGTPPSEKRYNE